VSIQTVVQPGENATPIAWRCEQDRKLHPATEPSAVVYIEEINAQWSFVGGTRRHGYFTRRMIVCRPCRRTIADVEPEASPAGGTQEGSKP
jgi:hypothetical protein